MTKTTNLFLFLAIATILIVSPLAYESAFADPKDKHKDKKPHDDKKAKTGEHDLKCKLIGSWFDPELTDDLVFSSSEGKCSTGLGHVTSASITAITGVTAEGCLMLSSATDLPAFSMGKKGFIEYTTTATQCFWDENGDATLPGAWCTEGGAHTSTVTGINLITGGLVKDTPVVGGSVDFVSQANHCAGDTAPYGNSFTTELEGTIVFPELEI